MVRRWSRKQTTDEIRQTPDEIKKKKPRRDKANPRRDKTNPRRQDQVYRGCTQRRDCGDTIHAQGWQDNSGLHKRHHTETVSRGISASLEVHKISPSHQGPGSMTLLSTKTQVMKFGISLCQIHSLSNLKLSHMPSGQLQL